MPGRFYLQTKTYANNRWGKGSATAGVTEFRLRLRMEHNTKLGGHDEGYSYEGGTMARLRIQSALTASPKRLRKSN